MLTPRRITLAAQTADHANGSRMLPNVQVEYSSVCPFNSDATCLLLLHFSYFALYDGDGKYLFDCTENGRFIVNASSRPRWSATNENVFSYFSGNEIRNYYTPSRTSELVHRFDEYTRIDDGGEADLAIDGRVRVICGTKPNGEQEIFLYELHKDIVGPRLSTEGHNWNNLYLAANGYQFLIGWSEYGTAPFQGIWLYEWDLRTRRNLAPVLGHMDVGRDTDGSDVMIWNSSADKAPICGSTGTGIVKVPLNGAPSACITTFPWDVAMHISCPMTRLGEFFISTYGSVPGTVYRCSMKPGSVEKLFDVKHVATDYDREPKFSCNRDGSKGVYIEGEDVYLATLTASPPAPVASEPSTKDPEFRTDKCGIFFRNGEIAALAINPQLAQRIVEKMNS